MVAFLFVLQRDPLHNFPADVFVLAHMRPQITTHAHARTPHKPACVERMPCLLANAVF